MYRKFKEPFNLDPERNHAGADCKDQLNGWICTRSENHEDVHRASGGIYVYAEWDNDRTTD